MSRTRWITGHPDPEQARIDEELRRQHLIFEDEYRSMRREIDRLRSELELVTAKDRGEVWYWQDEGDNHLGSISCPIQIRADTLRAIVSGDHSSLENDIIGES